MGRKKLPSAKSTYTERHKEYYQRNREKILLKQKQARAIKKKEKLNKESKWEKLVIWVLSLFLSCVIYFVLLLIFWYICHWIRDWFMEWVYLLSAIVVIGLTNMFYSLAVNND